MTDFLSLLEENQKQVIPNTIYNMLVFSIASKYVCKTSRENFLIERTTKGVNDFKTDNSAKSYLNCFSNVVNASKGKCNNKFSRVHSCLEQKGKIETFPLDCVSHMEEFIDCTSKH